MMLAVTCLLISVHSILNNMHASKTPCCYSDGSHASTGMEHVLHTFTDPLHLLTVLQAVLVYM